MLVSHAKGAGMKVPDLDNFDYDGNEFPHFEVFCNAQIGRPIKNWHHDVVNNAQVIAKIPADKINKVTFKDLDDLGFV